jgi:tetratricopeptide (TPR) repeat protein
MSDIPSPAPQSRVRQMARGLRPFLWWLVLVLLLFALRTHERLSEKTHISFTATLQGQPVRDEVTAMLDQQRITSGDRVSIGPHQFTVTHPKADQFSTNLSFWYGEHDLGEIVLNRSKGTLVIHANPSADTLTILGPELALTLTNSPGMNSSVPTDRYRVEANYRHWRQAQEIIIFPNQSGMVSITPRLGAVRMTCNQANASFQVLKIDGQLLEAGDFPSTIRDVPEGNYKVIAWQKRNQQERTLAVKAAMLNDMNIEFLYGAAVLETEPPGATVTGSDGQEWGRTPLRLEELLPGRRQLELRRDGYERVFVSFDVEPLQTNSFRTNLVSVNYGKSLNAAREYLIAANYAAAVEAATAALQAKPNDREAIAVQKEALGKRNLRQAQAFGKKGDYTAGIRELELALQALPESEEAKELLADFKQREPEQIERQRQERLNRGKELFDAVLLHHGDQDYFDPHELKTTKPVKEVRTGILEALKRQPAFQVTKNDSTVPETFEIEAGQEITTILATSAGRRQCVIVGARTKDDETQILFKVLEYKSEAAIKFSIGNLIGAPGEVKYVPIHTLGTGTLSEKLQSQVKEGVQIATERIQRAIGQDPGKKQ